MNQKEWNPPPQLGGLSYCNFTQANFHDSHEFDGFFFKKLASLSVLLLLLLLLLLQLLIIMTMMSMMTMRLMVTMMMTRTMMTMMMTTSTTWSFRKNLRMGPPGNGDCQHNFNLTPGFKVI
ncbi:hypothetical protein CRM22_000066 [Opisthorchis felineus]|uniref:Uncharacterized protein n=1 Tax=Opisthorchis felineus TaxID=147828 RepID=A0A4S2MGN7_OPIFE|nr:hypothetical protein CRM22_000066 [Opisthorchis felineus]